MASSSMPAWPPLATGNDGTFWTWRPGVSWLSSWLLISRPTDWPQSSWTDRSAGCHPLPSPPVHWLLQGPREILWWVIKPNCLHGWLAPRSWMTNITVPRLLQPLLSLQVCYVQGGSVQARMHSSAGPVGNTDTECFRISLLALFVLCALQQ